MRKIYFKKIDKSDDNDVINFLLKKGYKMDNIKAVLEEDVK